MNDVIASQTIDDVVICRAVQGFGTGSAIDGGESHARDSDIERIGRSQMTAIDGRHGHAVRSSHIGCAAECAGSRVEAEPSRQGAAISQGCAIGQRVARVRVGKSIGIEGIAEHSALCRRMIQQGDGQDGGMIDRCDIQHTLDGIERPYGSIMEPDLFDRIRSDAVVFQIIPDGQHIPCINTQNQVIPRTGQYYVLGCNSVVKLHDIKFSGCRIVTIDYILTRIFSE